MLSKKPSIPQKVGDLGVANKEIDSGWRRACFEVDGGVKDASSNGRFGVV